jgi:hypothetical protein
MAKKKIKECLQEPAKLETQLHKKQVKNHIHIIEFENGEINVETDIKKASDVLGRLEFAKMNIFAHVYKINNVEILEK